jgi:hypothetical protein
MLLGTYAGAFQYLRRRNLRQLPMATSFSSFKVQRQTRAYLEMEKHDG